MSDERETNDRLITGREIIAEILRNADANQFALRKSVLLPSIYSIYLHSAELEYIRPILPALTAEARAALAEHLEKRNGKGPFAPLARALGLESEDRAEYKIADADWTIEFYPDTEDRLERGDIEVHSTLASTPKPEFDGAMTRQVTRKLHVEDSDSAMGAASAASAPTVRTTDTYATLTWEENGARKEFVMNKPEFVIGRGSRTHWADLKLESAPADISREHCRIRRDERGNFHISDSSQFGTSVDGKLVAKSPNTSPLPAHATISLAGVLEIRFEAAEK